MVLLVYQAALVFLLVALVLFPFLLLFCERNFGVIFHTTRTGITVFTLCFIIALFFCFKWERSNAFIVMVV